jgi:hypothetical protein
MCNLKSLMSMGLASPSSEAPFYFSDFVNVRNDESHQSCLSFAVSRISAAAEF